MGFWFACRFLGLDSLNSGSVSRGFGNRWRRRRGIGNGFICSDNSITNDCSYDIARVLLDTFGEASTQHNTLESCLGVLKHDVFATIAYGSDNRFEPDI